MATFTVDFFTSLDGNGSARGWPGYWGKEGPELREDRVRTFAQDQVLVFGATTFREFCSSSSSTTDPIDSLDSFPKIVFSRTLREPLGGRLHASRTMRDAVERFKRETDVRALARQHHAQPGCPRRDWSTASSHRLPTITGKPAKAALFKDGPEFDLELLESTVLDGRTQELVYIPHVHAGIPAGVGPQRRDAWRRTRQGFRLLGQDGGMRQGAVGHVRMVERGGRPVVQKRMTDPFRHDTEVLALRALEATGIPAPELIDVRPGSILMTLMPGERLDSTSTMRESPASVRRPPCSISFTPCGRSRPSARSGR